MKKIISLLLIVMVMSTFVACKKDEGKAADENKPATEQNVSEENGEATGEETPEELPVITKEEDLPEEYAPTEEVNQEDGSVEVKEKLIGKWTAKSGDNTLVLEFLEGMVTFTVGEKGLEGQYAIDMEKSVIYVELLAADGMVKNEFPFTYEDGNLKILNKEGVETFFKE